MSFVLSAGDSGFSAAFGSSLGVPSAPVIVVGLRWEASSRSIVVACSDGRFRTCRVDRLSSPDAAVALTAFLRRVRAEAVPVCFRAAGANSPDRWFCWVGVEGA